MEKSKTLVETVPVSILTPEPRYIAPAATRPENAVIAIEFAPALAADDDNLVTTLTSIVNTVYDETQGGIYVEGFQRTNADEIRYIIQAGELGVAYLSSSRHAVGCIRIRKISSTHGEFGMLALDAAYRGGGMGRDMARFAEDHCRTIGLEVMQLELLFPVDFEHTFKKRLQDWYGRMGYQVVKLAAFQDEYPKLAALLKEPCEYRVFEKNLI